MENKYLPYSPSDLATDTVFIDWILNPSEEKDRLWNSWLDEHPELHAKIMEAKKMVSYLKIETNAIPESTTDQLWKRINQTIEQPSIGIERPFVSRRRILYIGSSAAAAVVIFLILFNWGNLTRKKINTGLAEHIAYTLPDQSVVNLNAKSTVRYHENNWFEKRTISLEGEAFFEVVKGDPFEVQTDMGNIKVLGTSFNVFARKKQFEVRCFTGKVDVSHSDQSVILEAGEQVKMDASGILGKSTFLIEDENSWRAGTFRFEEIPLQDVFEEFERQFGVRIKADRHIRERIYTGFFENKNIDDALYEICWPMQLQSEKIGRTVTISSSE